MLNLSRLNNLNGLGVRKPLGGGAPPPPATYYRFPLISSANNGALVNTTDAYFEPTGLLTAGTVRAENELVIKTAGYLKAIRTYLSVNGSGVAPVLKLYKNGVYDSTLNCTITAGVTGHYASASLTASVSVAVDDKISIFLDRGGDTGSISISYIGIDYLTTTGTSIYASTGASTLSTASVTRNIRLNGIITQLNGSTKSSQTIMTASGTFKNGMLLVGASVRATNTTFELYKNGSATGMIITVTSGTPTDTWLGLDTPSNTFTVAEGDYVEWVITTGTGVDTIGFKGIQVEFEPTSAGVTSLSMSYNSGTLGVSTTRGNNFGGSVNYAVTTSRFNTRFYGAGTIDKLYLGNQTDTSDAGSYAIYTTYKGGVAQTLLKQVTAPPSTSSDTVNSFTFADADLLRIESTRGAGSGTHTSNQTSVRLSLTAETL